MKDSTTTRISITRNGHFNRFKDDEYFCLIENTLEPPYEQIGQDEVDRLYAIPEDDRNSLATLSKEDIFFRHHHPRSIHAVLDPIEEYGESLFPRSERFVDLVDNGDFASITIDNITYCLLAALYRSCIVYYSIKVKPYHPRNIPQWWRIVLRSICDVMQSMRDDIPQDQIHLHLALEPKYQSKVYCHAILYMRHLYSDAVLFASSYSLRNGQTPVIVEMRERLHREEAERQATKQKQAEAVITETVIQVAEPLPIPSPTVTPPTGSPPTAAETATPAPLPQNLLDLSAYETPALEVSRPDGRPTDPSTGIVTPREPIERTFASTHAQLSAVGWSAEQSAQAASSDEPLSALLEAASISSANEQGGGTSGRDDKDDKSVQ